MILVDTSVWIDHLRRGDAELAAALTRGEVLTHSFVVGELACGNLRNRREILELLANLPLVPSARDAEVLRLIDSHKLMGCGIGYVDAHLLAATAIHGTARLWTRDRPLGAIASKMKLGHGTS